MASNRANWDEATTRTFLALCIEEKNNLNATDKGLTKHGWQNLYRKFRQRTGHIYDNKQLHNKLSQMQRTYMHWRELQQQAGLGRDKNTGGVAADDSYWESEEGDTGAGEQNRGNPPPSSLKNWSCFSAAPPKTGEFCSVPEVSVGNHQVMRARILQSTLQVTPLSNPVSGIGPKDL